MDDDTTRRRRSSGPSLTIPSLTVAALVAAALLSGCSLVSTSSEATASPTTIEVTLVDPATFEAQGTRDTWCAVAPDGVARPLGDKSIFLADADTMRAAFAEENSMLTRLAPSVPPELSESYVSAVNGTRQIEAAMVAADFRLEDTGPEFNDADSQLSVAWNAMNGYSRRECS